jgi:hypothetical protein
MAGRGSISSLEIVLDNFPNDDVRILLLLGLAGTGGAIPYMRRRQAEYFKSVPIELLGFGPEGPTHENILHRWLRDPLQQWACLAGGKDCGGIEFSTDASFLGFVDSKTFVCEQYLRLIHQSQGLLFGGLVLLP